MTFRAQLVFVATFLTMATPCSSQADEADDAKVRRSVVKIFATLRHPDVFRPWSKENQQEATGSGVVIAGKRILTNAHMVNHSSQVFIQPDKTSDKLAVNVEAIAPGIDLAVLKLQDESFFDSHPPLPLRLQLPKIQQTVFAYGYPEGGTDLSITRGIVSRLEYAEYYLYVEGLRIQVDAAINPGNSGGPAMVDGQMVGLVFSRLSQSDNIGYIIPTEEINLFLKDIRDGHYDGKPILDAEVQNLENDALRAKLKLDKKTSGVWVRKVYASDASYPLHVGDVITRIGDHLIDNAGMVHNEAGHHLKFQYLVQYLVRDNHIPMTILRDGREMKHTVPVGPAQDYRLFPYLADTYPSYFIYGPLVFTDATSNFTTGFTYGDSPDAMLAYANQGNPLIRRYGDRPAFADERIVIVAQPMFTHRISKGYKSQYGHAVAAVNGVPVRNLKQMVEVLRDCDGEFVEFTFVGKFTENVVFKRSEALDATDEILNDNGIRRQFSLDIAPIWNQKK
jgi:S1-C subfamily serine protease